MSKKNLIKMLREEAGENRNWYGDVWLEPLSRCDMSALDNYVSKCTTGDPIPYIEEDFNPFFRELYVMRYLIFKKKEKIIDRILIASGYLGSERAHLAKERKNN